MARFLSRRRFLKGFGVGTAVVSLPAAALSGAFGADTGVPAPGKIMTYFEAFGVDTDLIGKLLAKGLARGGDFAEVYVQHKVSHWVTMEDGEVNSAYSTIDLGAGLRVLKGDATGFAYCEELTEKALLKTMETAAAIADAKPLGRPTPLAPVALTSRFPVDVPWTEVGIQKKLPIIVRADKTARARDRRIVKVSVSLADEANHILIANSEGLLVEDHLPNVVLSASCVGFDRGKTETGYQSAGARHGLVFLTNEVIDRVATTGGTNHEARLGDSPGHGQ